MYDLNPMKPSYFRIEIIVGVFSLNVREYAFFNGYEQIISSERHSKKFLKRRIVG